MQLYTSRIFSIERTLNASARQILTLSRNRTGNGRAWALHANMISRAEDRPD